MRLSEGQSSQQNVLEILENIFCSIPKISILETKHNELWLFSDQNVSNSFGSLASLTGLFTVFECSNDVVVHNGQKLTDQIWADMKRDSSIRMWFAGRQENVAPLFLHGRRRWEHLDLADSGWRENPCGGNSVTGMESGHGEGVRCGCFCLLHNGSLCGFWWYPLMTRLLFRALNTLWKCKTRFNE